MSARSRVARHNVLGTTQEIHDNLCYDCKLHVNSSTAMAKDTNDNKLIFIRLIFI